MTTQQSSSPVLCTDGHWRIAPAGTQPSWVAFSYIHGQAPQGTDLLPLPGESPSPPGQLPWGSHRGRVTAGSGEQDAEAAQQALQMGSTGGRLLTQPVVYL